MPTRIIKSILLLLLITSFVICQTQKVASKDGVDIAYVVEGENEPSLVFIHGWSCDKSYWSGQIKTFSPKYKVVAIDLGDHGESGLNRDDWTVESYGEDVAAVVNHLKLDKIILIGHSMGGAVIIEAAKLLKGKVIGLVGADTYQSFTDDWKAEQKEEFLKPFKENFIETTKGFVRSMFPQTADSMLVKKVIDDMASAPPQVAVNTLHNVFFYDPIPTLKEINLPIITINCDMYPVNVDENKKYAEKFEVMLIKGAGHFVMLEKPKEFDKFLDEAVTELIKNN